MAIHGTSSHHVKRCRSLMRELEAAKDRLQRAASCSAGYADSMNIGVLVGRLDAAEASMASSDEVLREEILQAEEAALDALIRYEKRCMRGRSS